MRHARERASCLQASPAGTAHSDAKPFSYPDANFVGYLVGSAVKAVLVGARSLAEWLTRRNMARQ